MGVMRRRWKNEGWAEATTAAGSSSGLRWGVKLGIGILRLADSLNS